MAGLLGTAAVWSENEPFSNLKQRCMTSDRSLSPVTKRKYHRLPAGVLFTGGYPESQALHVAPQAGSLCFYESAFVKTRDGNIFIFGFLLIFGQIRKQRNVWLLTFDCCGASSAAMIKRQKSVTR
jgi:hypothetical protein